MSSLVGRPRRRLEGVRRPKAEARLQMAMDAFGNIAISEALAAEVMDGLDPATLRKMEQCEVLERCIAGLLQAAARG